MLYQSNEFFILKSSDTKHAYGDDKFLEYNNVLGLE